jgi:hypothetical protein
MGSKVCSFLQLNNATDTVLLSNVRKVGLCSSFQNFLFVIMVGVDFDVEISSVIELFRFLGTIGTETCGLGCKIKNHKSYLM